MNYSQTPRARRAAAGADPDRPPRVAVVVLNWNGWPDTLRCLDSLAGLTYPACRVLVVDNGSTDGSPTILRAHRPDLDLLALDRNLGFAGAVNRGARRALADGAELVWLLNNDTVVAADALSRLVAAAREHPQAGLFGCDLRPLDRPERPAPVVRGFDWLRGRVRMPARTQAEPGAEPVDLVSACAVLVRAEVFERVGPFDERYFLYFEDVDWALRARRAGFGCRLVHGAVVRHRGSAAARGDPRAPRAAFYYYHTRNNVLFMRAHARGAARLTFLPFLFGRTARTAAQVAAGALLAGKGNGPARLRALGAGLLDGFRGVSGPRDLDA